MILQQQKKREESSAYGIENVIHRPAWVRVFSIAVVIKSHVYHHHYLVTRVSHANMSAIYPAKAHADKVASQLPGGVFYLKGDTHHLRHDTDMELPFRQESNFFYVTGCYEADYQFIYANSESYLVIPVVTGTDLIWHGPQSLAFKDIFNTICSNS